jgi:hypothetical protein
MAFTVDRFVSDIKQARKEGDGQAAIQQVLARAVSEPGAMLRELGEPAEGGITPLYTDDTLSVFNVVWTPLMVLAPHNHLMWVSIAIYTGREDNIVWRRDNERRHPLGAEPHQQAHRRHPRLRRRSHHRPRPEPVGCGDPAPAAVRLRGHPEGLPGGERAASGKRVGTRGAGRQFRPVLSIIRTSHETKGVSHG